jgi:hypothetical protein
MSNYPDDFNAAASGLFPTAQETAALDAADAMAIKAWALIDRLNAVYTKSRAEIEAVAKDADDFLDMPFSMDGQFSDLRDFLAHACVKWPGNEGRFASGSPAWTVKSAKDEAYDWCIDRVAVERGA